MDKKTCLTVLTEILVYLNPSQVFLVSISISLSIYLYFLLFSDTQFSTKFFYQIFFKMAAAVLQPLQSLSLDNGIMAPSPISPNASRHGRSRHGGSVAGKKTRGRGYSIVDDREVLISKALSWALKRTVEEGEEQEGEEKLVADAEGWVDCEEVVRPPPLLSSLTTC